MSNREITGKQLAEWNQPDAYPQAKKSNELVDDPIERRIRLMEAAVADMARKVSFANQCYDDQWKYTRQLELTIAALSAHTLSSADFDLLKAFAEELRTP